MVKSLPSSRSNSPVRQILIIEDDDTVASYYDDLQRIHNENNPILECILTHVVCPIQKGLKTTRNQWRILLVGQFLSVLMAGQGAAQSTLYLSCHLSAPTFATGLVYVALTIHLIPVAWRIRHNLRNTNALLKGDAKHLLCNTVPLEASAWTYFGIALLDVEANYFTVLAFRFTSLTSACVLDAMAIPSAMIFSRFCCMHKRYLRIHLLGVFACLCGMLFNVYCDFQQESKEYPHLLIGDFLAMLGGIMFGARDVVTESFVREHGGASEYLGMIGLFGTLISLFQALILERHAVFSFFNAAAVEETTCPQQTGLYLLLTYVLATATRYVGQAQFLIVSEAALLNLSFLTGDLWSAIYEIVAQRIVPPSLFWVSLLLVVGGVFVYEIGGTPKEVNSSIPRGLELCDDASDVEVIEFDGTSLAEDEEDHPAKGRTWTSQATTNHTRGRTRNT